MTNPNRGMLLLNKTAGLTSFQSLNVCKRSFNTRKIGHAGTLDKFAEGLLLVFVNEATRLVPFFVGMDKTYIADIYFGQETDTLDPSGAIIRQAEPPELAQIQTCLPGFIGTIQQRPPEYSAIHLEGKRAYERVLAGENIEMPSRTVHIGGIEILDWQSPVLKIRVDCSSGTYIRSLARDIGKACGSAAYLSALTRTRIGPFSLDQAKIAPCAATDPDWAQEVFIEGRRLAGYLPNIDTIDIKPEYAAAFQSGKTINSDWFWLNQAPGGKVQDGLISVCAGDSFLGIAEHKDCQWSYRLVFPKSIP